MAGMTSRDFSLRALYDALDERRRQRGMTWSAVAAEISHSGARRAAVSTITGIRERRVAEGDGILQMLVWLGRTPESFMLDAGDDDAEGFRLPAATGTQVLRWDARALFAALDEERLRRQLTWAGVAREVGGLTPAMITGLASGGRVVMPPVMRLVRWLDRPAASFTRLSDW
jgi:hypothetical protein